MSAALAVGASALPSGDIGNKAKAAILITVTILVILILVVGFKKINDIINKFLVTFGLKDSEAAEKAADDLLKADAAANNVNSPFNPTFYKTAPVGTQLKTDAGAKLLAQQIYGSVGYMYDNPEQAYGAFKQCSNWATVSQICAKFNALYQKDCFDYLLYKFDTTKQKDTLAKIVNYCKSLPKYS